MHPLLTNLLQGRTLLLAVASPIEVRAVFAGLATDARVATPSVPAPWGVGSGGLGVSVLHSGVGKANAAGSLARHLIDGHPYGAILNVGIAGALPGAAATLRPGAAVVGYSCVFADEGIVTPDGYQSVSQMGFPVDPSLDSGPMEPFPTHPYLIRAFRSDVDMEGGIATVSTCSGTDALAREVAQRTGAIAETMEGAAFALVARRAGVPFCEVRTISNFTGDRAAQQWDIKGALARLSEVLARVVA